MKIIIPDLCKRIPIKRQFLPKVAWTVYNFIRKDSLCPEIQGVLLTKILGCSGSINLCSQYIQNAV